VRILVVTAEPVSADQLREALPTDIDPQDSEVMIVAPALHESALRFWLSDSDNAIARAEEVRRESLERLGDEGVSASADTGDSGTADAIEDALKSFPADRILVFTHPEGEQRYREDLNEDEVEARFKIPVTRAEIAPRG
jgi:hypothetical protein